MKFYSENFVHLFLNTSSSEGIPVSIMEAQSFGIPVMAPQVGGIPEIVSDENGKLFKPDSNPEQIAAAVSEMLALQPDQYQKLRLNAFSNWETHYNAEKNF